MSALLRRIRSFRTLTRAFSYSNHPRPTKTEEDKVQSQPPPTPKLGGTFCTAFSFPQGIVIGCDSRLTTGIKHKFTGHHDYLRYRTTNKLQILNEDICFMMSGNYAGCLKYNELIRQADVVLKHSEESHLPDDCYAEELIMYVERMIHALDKENLRVLNDISVIFVDRTRAFRSLIHYSLKSSMSYDQTNCMDSDFHDCMSVGFNIQMRDLADMVRYEDIATFTEAMEFCCVAANIAYTFEKTCGDDFRVYFANRDVPWSIIPNRVMTMADILKYGPCLGYSTHARIVLDAPPNLYIYTDRCAAPYDQRDYYSALERERGKLFVEGDFVRSLPRLRRPHVIRPGTTTGHDP